MIKILLAFDHELPLGEVSSTYEEAMLDPTYRIIESANKNGFKVNLFTDILCATAFKKNNITGFYSKYKTQLQTTLQSGHDVQLHIHPHWIDTTFVNNSFIPSKSFNLASFKDQAYPNNIEGIIEYSINELKKICTEVNSNYKCNSYRAGGFNFWPETEQILTALYKHGVRIDSSIVKDFYYKSGVSEVNFKNFHNYGNWFIPLSGPIDVISKSGIYEIPIASKPAGIVMNMKHLYFKNKYKKHAFSKGKPIHSGRTGKLDKLKFVFSSRPLGFDIISLHSNELLSILSSFIKRQKYTDDIIVSTVSHPKNMGPFSIKLMEEFVNKVRDKYPDAEFCTFTEIYNEKLRSHEHTIQN